jgi:hypothetical protein
MSATADETTDGQPPATPKWSRRRKVSVATAIVACAVVAGLFLPTAIAGWAPVLHWTCHPGNEAGELANYYIPAALVNSPYGGSGWGNGTIPVGSPLAPGRASPGVTAIAFGTGSLNGETESAFFSLNVSFDRLSNDKKWGPGPNARCSQPFGVGFAAPSIYAEVGGWIQGPNNTTDLNEPRYAILYEGTPDASRSLLFNNSYTASNAPQVDTCGNPSRSLPLVTVGRLQVWIPVTIEGTSYTIPYELSIEQTFHYVFPANFGVWQVDNLSAPGGPGGGWAFSYSPCP